VRRYASPEGDVEVDDEGSFLDIDTPEDCRACLGLAPVTSLMP
jgi:CTP:molybdopterin cytidylyltransferase MocA